MGETLVLIINKYTERIKGFIFYIIGYQGNRFLNDFDIFFIGLINLERKLYENYVENGNILLKFYKS